MRILLIAPEQPDINAVPEIRSICNKHHVSILNGNVSIGDVYQECRMTNFQMIHFATHSDATGVALSRGEMLTAEDIAQLARITEAVCVFFNSCLSGRLASYAVRHGVRYAIYSNIELVDREAWKMPSAFYDSLRNGQAFDFAGAYLVGDNGGGEYGLDVSPEWLSQLQERPLPKTATKIDVSLNTILLFLAAIAVIAVVLLRA